MKKEKQNKTTIVVYMGNQKNTTVSFSTEKGRQVIQDINNGVEIEVPEKVANQLIQGDWILKNNSTNEKEGT